MLAMFRAPFRTAAETAALHADPKSTITLTAKVPLHITIANPAADRAARLAFEIGSPGHEREFAGVTFDEREVAAFKLDGASFAAREGFALLGIQNVSSRSLAICAPFSLIFRSASGTIRSIGIEHPALLPAGETLFHQSVLATYQGFEQFQIEAGVMQGARVLAEQFLVEEGGCPRLDQRIEIDDGKHANGQPAIGLGLVRFDALQQVIGGVPSLDRSMLPTRSIVSSRRGCSLWPGQFALRHVRPKNR